MNINNGKTGNVNIPGALHSTGGDGDGQVGGVVAYAGDVYDETLGKNQKEINQTLLSRGSDSDVIAIALNDLNEKVEDQERVTSSALNDLSDKTDNLNKDVENLEKITSSSLNDLNIKVEEQEKVTSSSLNDLNEKVDNLDNNESIIASSLNDLNDKVDNLKDSESVISSSLNDLNDRLKVIRETDDKIEFVGKKVIQKTNITAQLRNFNSSDLDDFIPSYVSVEKSYFGDNFTPEMEESLISEIRQMPEEQFDNIKVYENNQLNLSDSLSNYSGINLYKEKNGEELNYFEVIPSHSKLFLFIPGYTSNSLFIENLPYCSDNSEIPLATLEKETGDFYIEGISDSLQKTIKDNELATASALTDLEDNLQNLNLDFKNNLKVDNEGNLVVHEIGTYETETTTDSGFHLSNDYFKIYYALTYDPNSSTTVQLEGYTQESLRQLLIQQNLINPDYYYYVVLGEDEGYGYLTNSEFFSPNNHDVGFSKFTSIEINETDVEFSDYIEKFNSDGSFAYIVIGLETELSNEDLLDVTMTYEHNPEFDKYISKINLDNGKLYLLGIGDYTARNPSNGVLSIQEVIASLISRIETLEAQISGENS